MDHVDPYMVSHGKDSQECMVFGHAVLFQLFDRSRDDAFLPHRKMQIMQAYGDLGARNALDSYLKTFAGE